MDTLTRTVRLSRAQAAFRASKARYRGFVGGRGAGKSWVGAYDLIRRMEPGGAYLIGSPTGVLMQDTTFPTFRQIAEELGVWAGVRLSPYPTARIRLVTARGQAGEAEVRFRTAEKPERMRGPNLRGAWLDEASLMDAEVRRVMLGALRDAGRLGWMSATFTPQGVQHWTYEAFASGLPDTAMIRARTADNPFNHPDFAKGLKEQWGDTLYARQELDGEFVSLEGAEFPGEWFTRPDLWFDAWPDDLALKVIALDPSKGTDGKGQDFQAHVMIGVALESGRYVFYVDADLDRIGVVQMCERTAELTRRFSAEGGTRLVDSVVCEENGTLGLLKPALDAACVKLRVNVPYLLRTNTDKKEFRIRAQVSPPLSRGQLRFRRTAGGRHLVGDLQSFPRGEHDDSIDALATGLRRVSELLMGAR